MTYMDEVRASAPMGQVPYMGVDVMPLKQSGALARVRGKLAGLDSREDDWAAAKVIVIYKTPLLFYTFSI